MMRQRDEPTVVADGNSERARKAHRSMIEALRWLATQACDEWNCGTVCLCAPCHARRAIEYFDPEWKP